MSEIEKLTQKIMIEKALIFIEELKLTDDLNKKEIQTLVLNEYKLTLEDLSRSIEENELLLEKLEESKKQREVLFNIIDDLKKKN
jgi:hypothetical protein